MLNNHIKIAFVVTGAVALVLLLALVLSPWWLFKDVPRPQPTRTAEAGLPLYKLNPLTLNCKVGQKKSRYLGTAERLGLDPGPW
jgi:flagellar basal body-associated protein FliL